MKFDVEDGRARERCWRLLSILGRPSGGWEHLPQHGEEMSKWLDALGGRFQHCRWPTCGRPVWWFKTKNGKKMPVAENGASHFADCNGASVLRGSRKEGQ